MFRPEQQQIYFSFSKEIPIGVNAFLSRLVVQWACIHSYSLNQWNVSFFTRREWQRFAITKIQSSMVYCTALRSKISTAQSRVMRAPIKIACRKCSSSLASRKQKIYKCEQMQGELASCSRVATHVAPWYFFSDTSRYLVSFTRKNSAVVLVSSSTRDWSVRTRSRLLLSYIRRPFSLFFYPCGSSAQ